MVEAGTAKDERRLSPAEVRQRARSGRLTGHTAGLAPRHVQGNLAILPAEAATEFLIYCQRNPKPCPLLAVGEPGDPFLPMLGEEIDVRSDLPRYRIFRHGRLEDRPTDIRDVWRDDLVPFVLGCSFSFEEALLEEGIVLKHIEQGTNVPMYRTNLQTQPAGRFHGELVVSMRPLSAADAIRAIQVTSRFAQVHGAPVHIGDPALIGVGDLDAPDFGDATVVASDELPVFWACGVTPQVAIRDAELDLCITHDPGSMLVTDRLNAYLAAF